jgi:crotonobetainyl-CoA:carnitine CoA-transferase CaiB-like acyl-CoA transferase
MVYDVLEGVTVVELSMYAFAPSAAAVMADWGAEVVKVVVPDLRDAMMGNPIGGIPTDDVGVAFMWEFLNRGKRAIGIDVTVDAGRELLIDLVRDADVFITNLLPGRRQKFRLEPEDLFAINPRLIYGRASGHGNKGPERESGGFDHTDFWARSGVGHAASMATDEFAPQLGPAFGDVSAGAFFAGAMAAALFRRERTGRGATVDVSLLSSGMWMASPGIVASQIYNIDNIPRFRHADLPNPLVGAYKTRDERHIYLAGIRTDGHFEQFCHLIGRGDLLSDPRFADTAARSLNSRECIAELDDVFAERDVEEWQKILAGLTTPWCVVQSAAEAASDPQATANGYLVEVEGVKRSYSLVASPAQFDDESPGLTRAPDHGEHTDELLLERGLNWDDIVLLKEKGAVL